MACLCCLLLEIGLLFHLTDCVFFASCCFLCSFPFLGVEVLFLVEGLFCGVIVVPCFESPLGIVRKGVL